MSTPEQYQAVIHQLQKLLSEAHDKIDTQQAEIWLLRRKLQKATHIAPPHGVETKSGGYELC